MFQIKVLCLIWFYFGLLTESQGKICIHRGECELDSQCCSKRCRYGSCWDSSDMMPSQESCTAEGGYCVQHANCCSQFCLRPLGLCQIKGMPWICKESGERWQSGHDCCPGFGCDFTNVEGKFLKLCVSKT